MSYSQRPMGDYATYGYAGDPGWLSSAFKFIKKKVIPFAKDLLGSGGGQVAVATAAGMAGAQMGGGKMPAPPGSLGGAVTFPGGTRLSVAGVVPALGGMAGQQPAGYHLDKRTRSRWVRNRRMNVANPRALRKAIRRVQGFEKLAKRTITMTRRTRLKKG